MRNAVFSEVRNENLIISLKNVYGIFFLQTFLINPDLSSKDPE